MGKLSGFGRAWRWAVVILLPTCTALAFAYVAGWLAPGRLTPDRLVDAFERLPGSYPGYRRNHAKGICVEGYFDSDGGASPWIRASLFAKGRVPVVGRFSMPGANPIAADGKAMVRSLALRFSPAGSAEWRTAMNSVPVFSVRTPQAMLEQLRAMHADPFTGRVDMAAENRFYATHPETRTMRDWLAAHPPSSSYGNGAYYSVNAFRITDTGGTMRLARWRMEPMLAYQPLPADTRADDDVLEHDLARRLADGPLRWRLVFTVAGPGDAGNDATRLWPASRQQFEAGTLVIQRAEKQILGSCRDLVFDPLILPEGMAASDDPLLSARSAVYTDSFRRRLGEEAARRGFAR